VFIVDNEWISSADSQCTANGNHAAAAATVRRAAAAAEILGRYGRLARDPE